MEIDKFSIVSDKIIKSVAEFKNKDICKDEFNLKLLMVLSNAFISNKSNIIGPFEGYYLPYSRLSLSVELKGKEFEKDEIIIKNEEGLPTISNSFDFYQCAIAQNDNVKIDKKADEELIDLIDQIDIQEEMSNNVKMISDCFCKKSKATSNNVSMSCLVSTMDESRNSNNNSTKIKKIDDYRLILIDNKIKEFYMKKMNQDYLECMYIHYQHLLDKIALIGSSEQKKSIFSKIYKTFLYKHGITLTKLCNKLMRNLAFTEGNEISFEEFITNLNPILQLTISNGVIKNKFLLSVLNVNDKEYFTPEDIERYFNILKCKYVMEKEINEEIIKKLIRRYKLMYYPLEEKENINNDKYNVKKLEIILETFYS